jgi:hypothetical protein
MANIPSSSIKFAGLAANYPTAEKRSKLINSESNYYSINDITYSVGNGNAIKFLINKNEYVVSSRLNNGKYYLLGIDFGDFAFEEGTTYTLLIDRFRFSERKDSNGAVRNARFYHEHIQQAIDNNRLSEVEITDSVQYFDFNQDFYFRAFADGKYPKGTGMSDKAVGFVKLAFRMRIDDGVNTPVETGYLGYITMNGTGDIKGFISYRQ